MKYKNLFNWFKAKYLTLYSVAFIRFNRVFIFAIQKEYPFIFVAIIKLGQAKLVESNYEGICPVCHEHTTAGNSCCGAGAYVDGGLVSDEEAIDEQNNPRICVNLLVNASQEYCKRVHSALFNSYISSNFFSGTYAGTEYFTSSGTVVTDLSDTIELGVSKIYPTGELIHKLTGEHVYGSPKYAGWNVNIFLDAAKQ